jgi:hypothetical protein
VAGASHLIEGKNRWRGLCAEAAERGELSPYRGQKQMERLVCGGSEAWEAPLTLSRLSASWYAC